MAFKEEEKLPSIDDNFADDGNGTGSDDSGITVDPDKDNMVFLTFPMINLSECGSCIFAEYNACVKSCPYDAISYDSIDKNCVISQKNCAASVCGRPCLEACPKSAITYQNIERPSRQEGAVKNTLVCFSCDGYEECISSCPANAITRDGFYCEVDEETGLYVTEISLELIPEGLVTIDARVTDSAGKVAIKRMSIFRDVTAPIVETILPAPGDVING